MSTTQIRRRRRPARRDPQDLHRGLHPNASAESFAGVANHWLLDRVEPGQVALDLGCGARTDLLIAAPSCRPQIADVVIYQEVSADARKRIDLGTG
jgi:hypothetical protein